MISPAQKIIIINCSLSYQHKAVSQHLFPSTACMLLATVLHNAKKQVTLLDGCLSDIADFKNELAEHLKENVLFVGLSVMTSQLPWAYEISKHIKALAPDVPVVWGGVHATLFPEQTASDPNVDIVAINESVSETLLPLTDALENETPLSEVPGLCFEKNGEIIRTRPACLDKIEDMPFIDFSLMNHDRYSRDNILWSFYPDNVPKEDSITYPIVTGLGCAYKCNFCINVILRRRYRHRSAKEIVDRIEFLQKEYGAKFFQFLDEDFLINKKRTLEFLDLVEARKLKFFYRAWLRLDYFGDHYVDVNLAKRLHDNGMLIAVMGAESGSQKTLDRINKGIKKEQIPQAANILKQTNIIPRFSFMVGLPGETKEDINETTQLCEKLRSENPRADVPVINFRPYPGSPMYNDIMRDSSIQNPESLKEWCQIKAEQGYGYIPIEESKWIEDPKLIRNAISL